jgi:hypothetical protein
MKWYLADRMPILADRAREKADRTGQMADTPNSQRKLAPKPFKFRGKVWLLNR